MISPSAWSAIMQVEGWLSPDVLPALNLIAEIQEVDHVTRGVLEIGVHHGKFLSALALLARPGEPIVGVDVFGDQAANVDGSGHGDAVRTRGNVLRIAQREPILIHSDSLLIAPAALRCAYGGFRLISIDGCHTARHTYNDMSIAVTTIAPGGVIIVDDYYHPDWPGVHEGVGRFLGEPLSTLAIVAYSANKLYLVERPWHGRYFEAFRDRFPGKGVEMYGERALVFQPIKEAS